MSLLEALPNAQIISIAPGRVNLLGEHVDYNGGAVLPIAIDRVVQVAAIPEKDPIVKVHAIDLNEKVTFNLNDLERKIDISGKPLPGWALFPAGVAWAFRKQGMPVRGLTAAFTSNIPIGAGLSSSAAVEVAFAATWEAFGGWHLDRLTLAQYCQQAENRYVGVNCGLMDQFASANGVAGCVLSFDTRSLMWEAIPLPQNTVVVVADSSVRRSLASSAYNDRRQSCRKAVEIIQKSIPTIQYLAEISPAEFNSLASQLPETIRKHARHVVEECARVRKATNALKKEDIGAFGQLMVEGHNSLRDLYGVSTPELNALVEVARWLPGCYGSRLTGAGFGGCTVSLVDAAHAERFAVDLKRGYWNATSYMAEVYICSASPGVRIQIV
jgi:galactokinase